MYERPDERRIAGDIYLGAVEAVVPGLQAAFVDIGTQKAGFLHVSDLEPEEADDDETTDDPRTEAGPRTAAAGAGGTSRRSRTSSPRGSLSSCR